MSQPFIIAATGCPTGVAHTFMAEETLIQAAQARGIEIKVETHGQVGIENELSQADIDRATGVIVVADKDVHSERFTGKPLVEVSVKTGIHEADRLLDMVLSRASVQAGATTKATTERATDDHDFLDVASIDTADQRGWRRAGRAVYKHLMNGVSHMLPFVVGGGVLIAASFLWGIYSADPSSEQYNRFAAMLLEIGGTALNLMVPVLSAFIAASISKRPGLTVGLITGMVAYVNGTGFIGGIITGFLSGYGMLLLAHVLRGLPAALNGLKAIFIYPVAGTLVFGGITYVLSAPLAGASTALQSFLTGFQGSNPIILGLIIGVMCAFDMGGPVNKAAYVTGVALLAEGNIEFMAAVSAACIAPPLVTAIATTIFRKGFDPAERRAGTVNYVLGSTHITEGAIPFAARNPIVVIPILMVASSISAILTLLWNVGSPAPHGGFLILPVVTNALPWVLAIAIGSLVGAVLFGTYRVRHAAQQQALDLDPNTL